MSGQEKGMEIEDYTVYMDSEKKRWVRLFFDFSNKKMEVRGPDEQPIIHNLGVAEVRVLYQFVSRPGEVFSKEQLILFGWPGRVVTVGSLTQAVFNIRSFFGANGHDVIVTSPKAGYKFNPDFLVGVLGVEKQSREENREIISIENVISIKDEGFTGPIVGGRRKRIAVYLLAAVGVLFFLVLSVYLLRPEFEILAKDPLKITRFYVGDLGIDFITSVKKDVAAPLRGQIKDISGGYHGRVMVRIHDKRYRVVCYTVGGSSSYAVPITVPLSYVIEKCMSRAG